MFFDNETRRRGGGVSIRESVSANVPFTSRRCTALLPQNFLVEKLNVVCGSGNRLNFQKKKGRFRPDMSQ